MITNTTHNLITLYIVDCRWDSDKAHANTHQLIFRLFLCNFFVAFKLMYSWFKVLFCGKLLKIFAFFAFLLFLPDTCYGLQSHGAPEGLYVHQMAHIFFIVGLVYLNWDIKRRSLTEPGWPYLRMFCILMICWNIVAFTGHFVGELIPSDHIQKGESYLLGRMLGPFTAAKLIYYFAKFDHLLAVPAQIFLYLALRTMRNSLEQSAEVQGK